MIDSKKMYKLYHDKIHTAGDQIHLKSITSIPRKGARKVIDNVVFYKSAFQNGQSWAALPSSLLHWVALTPIAIANVNEVLKVIGVPLVVPLSWGSLVAVGLISSLMLFGVFAWTKLGTVKRGSELSTLQDSGRYLLFCEQQEIKELIYELNKKIEKLENGK